jgi:hypothetical protein
MIGFISHLYNLLLDFPSHYMAHYVYSSPSSSTADSRDSFNSQLTAHLELRNSSDSSQSESATYVTTDGSVGQSVLE